jgi:ssDNA-binding replication factor A large subunit
MKLYELRPGMEKVDLRVEILGLKEPRQVTTNSGLTHTLVEGEVEDETGKMGLTVWNEKIEQLERIEVGKTVDLLNCFITSFRGVLSVNVGRDSEISIPQEKA